MKASELRIGNYIFLTKDFNKSYFFTQTSGALIDYIECESVLSSPIQLKEEWLLNFGFERTFKKLKGCYVDKHSKYMLCDNNENGFDIYIFGYDEDLYINSINYIHQLQNLFFALIGEELTIKEL